MIYAEVTCGLFCVLCNRTYENGENRITFLLCSEIKV